MSDAERLDYTNMLGACLGHINGTKGADDTCDTHKQNTVITVNPQDMTTLKKIKYRSATGEVYSEDEKIQEDLNRTLNLNSSKHMLMANRKAVLDTAIMELRKMQQKGIWNHKLMESVKAIYEGIDSDGKRKEYAGIVLWYLEKRLK